MRVIEPRQFRKNNQKRRLFGRLIAFVVIAGVASGGWVVYQNPPRTKRTAVVQPAVQSAQVYDISTDAAHPRPIKKFAGNDFKNLIQSLAYPNTQLFTQPPVITGDIQADNRIRKLAEARGYEMTSLPVMSIVRTDQAIYGENDLLQPLANEAWLAIKEAADENSIPLTILAGYRSAESQRELFLERLFAKGISVKQIADGKADAAVKSTLEMTAVPGYSRHHTGYTVDFRCEDGSPNFGSSKCFTWLNANNYEQAKEFGWIPSYPAESDEQGPEPEPWEYVWVGHEAVSGQ